MKKIIKKALPREFSLYKAVTAGAKEVKVKYFDTKEAAMSYAPKMKSWPITNVVPARDPKNGSFCGKWALVCCK